MNRSILSIEPCHRSNDKLIIYNSDENNQETNDPHQRMTASVLNNDMAEDSTLMRLTLVMERSTHTIITI